MRIYRAILVGSLAMFAIPSAAQWNENGKPVPDSDSAKHDNEFAAMLLVVSDLQATFAAWEERGPGVSLPESKSAKLNKPFGAVVVFRGCKAGAAGNCDATVSFRIYRPDGTLYTKQDPATLWRFAPPPGKALQLSEQNLGPVIDSPNPPGFYIIEATVRDQVANVSLNLRKRIQVVQ